MRHGGEADGFRSGGDTLPELLGNGKDVVQLAYSNEMRVGLLCWIVALRPLATVIPLRTGFPETCSGPPWRLARS